MVYRFILTHRKVLPEDPFQQKTRQCAKTKEILTNFQAVFQLYVYYFCVQSSVGLQIQTFNCINIVNQPFKTHQKLLNKQLQLIFMQFSTTDCLNSWGTPYLETPQNLLKCVLGYSLMCSKLILGCILSWT